MMRQDEMTNALLGYSQEDITVAEETNGISIITIDPLKAERVFLLEGCDDVGRCN